MGNNRFKPRASQIAEARHDRKIRDHLFELRSDEVIDVEYLNKYIGKITFFTGTLSYVKPNDYCKRFRFSTTRLVPYKIINSLIYKHLPLDSKMSPASFYKYSHAIDIVFPFGVRVDTFVWRITKALEHQL